MAAWWLIDLVEGVTHHALGRWLSSPVRSFLMAVFFFVVHVARERLPDWFMEVALGQWIALALQMTVGSVGIYLFRLPLLDTHRKGAAWAWSAVGIAIAVGLVIKTELNEFVLWPIITVVSWTISQAAFIARWVGSPGRAYASAALLRSLYAFLFFVFIATIGAAFGAGPRHDQNSFVLLHGMLFCLLMTPIHYRAERMLGTF